MSASEDQGATAVLMAAAAAGRLVRPVATPSDVRTSGSDCSSSSYSSRIIVAGGGGGSGNSANAIFGIGGAGGGTTGEKGSPGSGCPSGGGGGTSSAGGSSGGSSGGVGALAVGGSAGGHNGAGGGGYYGGGGGNGSCGGSADTQAAGGGGSSYVESGASGTVFNRGYQSGDGQVTITSPPSSSTPSPTTSLASFSYTGGLQVYIVPSGVTQIGVELYGASGGSATGAHGGTGGVGGETTADIPVIPGQAIAVMAAGQVRQQGAAMTVVPFHPYSPGEVPVEGVAHQTSASTA